MFYLKRILKNSKSMLLLLFTILILVIHYPDSMLNQFQNQFFYHQNNSKTQFIHPFLNFEVILPNDDIFVLNENFPNK